ncbi:MAG: biosynthetic arginine decarboxylase [Neisseriaceae bacterium]|nr:biosynthetic arginine decarboxylase [Neisseriaceae bacterium]
MQGHSIFGKDKTPLSEIYNVRYWGNGYFYVNEQGEMCIRPNPSLPENSIVISDLVQKIKDEEGLQLPALLCFPQILQHRLSAINDAFSRAMNAFDYQGGYSLVYPIKVNQHRRVLETLTSSGQKMGLEAGSKAELMAVLSLADKADALVVCNGYKDREYIRLALMAEKLGRKVYLVIEKISELSIVLEEALKLKVKPRLGVRMRLSSQGSGKWQASGGDKSKFGLSAHQILQLLEILKQADELDSLQLLHFHLGSQLGNIRDVATAVRESARFYCELYQLGVRIQCFDVGGGLGVDYDGSRTQSDCSVNYGLNEYAETIVWGIGQACRENNLPQPLIITESGRAVSAHHAMLVSNVIGMESFIPEEPIAPDENAPRVLHSMWETWQDILQDVCGKKSLRSWIHESAFDLSEVHDQYNVGLLNLSQRSWAEQLYLNICYRVGEMFNERNRSHRTIIDELQERFADKLYVNFSLFQSLPDAWGIDQLFPVCPLNGLNQSQSRRAVLLDITCDSDGIINHYIDGDGIASTMPMPAYSHDNLPLIGFFMIGAYQEILGNMHNLFGDTMTVDVVINSDGEINYNITDEGNTISDMLRYVYLNPDEIIAAYRRQLAKSSLNKDEKKEISDALLAGLNGYTYLDAE